MGKANQGIGEAFSELVDAKALLVGVVFTAFLGLAIAAGSRWFQDFDSALVGYTFGSLFATFGIVYRYSVWLSKPSTRKYWIQGFRIFFKPRYWRAGLLPKLFLEAVLARIVFQSFILRRGKAKFIAHFLIAWGCSIAAAVTFPLVFGWLHFEQGQIKPFPTYSVIAFGWKVQELPLHGLQAWIVFHALVISSFMVVPGVMLAMYRRMRDAGETAIQRFVPDLMPLILLFLVAFSGLLLWINYEWMDGYYYGALAHFHAVSVIGTLLYLPFGKLFHVFQRPASLGVALYREIMKRERLARCPVTGEEFAPAQQVEDLAGILPDMGFRYESERASERWQEFSPKAKRMLIGCAHSKTRRGKFN